MTDNPIKVRRMIMAGLSASLCLFATSLATSVAKAGEAPSVPAPASPSASSALAKPLCDEKWDYDFSTIVIDFVEYDGKAEVKDYNPQKPDEPWSALSDQYLGFRHSSGAVFFRRFIGRFHDDAQAKALLKEVYSNSKYGKYLVPRMPPMVIHTGALLVSAKYTCTLDEGNPVLRGASWIAEVDGLLYAAKEAKFKGGKKQKSISVVDCKGDKTLLTDTWSAPCEATKVDSCLFPMSPGIMGIQQEYSASGEGRQLSFRGYDLRTRKKVFSFSEGYDSTGGPDDFMDVIDVDGDGVPELSDRHCDGGDCQRTRLRKWDGKKFVVVKQK